MNILYYTWNDSKYADELKKIGINVNVTNDSELVISELKQNNYTILIIDTISVINYKNLFQHIYDKDITIIPIAITEPNNNFILGDAMTLGLVDYIYDTLTPTQFINKIKGIRYLISKEKNDSPNVLLKIKDLTYNTSTREAKRGNEEFSLTLKEGKLLEMLIANKNNVVSREEIFEKIWEKDNVQDKNIGDVYITFLRRKLDNKFEDKLIKTVISLTKYLKYIFLILIVSISFTFYIYYISKDVKIETINNNIYKNKIIEDVIESFNLKFNNSKFELSEFENNEVNSIIYFTSQIYNFDEAYFIIEYKNFEINKINFYFNNIKNKNFDDVVDIISKLIEISDSSINTATSHKIVINMMNKFKDSKYNVTLIYNNSLTYSLTIKNNNGLEFSIS